MSFVFHRVFREAGGHNHHQVVRVIFIGVPSGAGITWVTVTSFAEYTVGMNVPGVNDNEEGEEPGPTFEIALLPFA